MKLKTVTVGDKTYAEIADGKPVYVGDDGKDIAFDAPGTSSTIARLTEESKGFKTRAQAAEGKLAGFEGIDDPVAAKKAIEIVKNLDDKKLVDAGKVEEIRRATELAVEAKFKPIVDERDKLKSDLDVEIIGGLFSRSKYIADKIAIPADLMQSRFARHFEVKDRKAVAKDASGNPIYSKARPGELADPDEAIEILVDQYPQKAHILKGTGAKGDGAKGGNGNPAGGAKSMTREQFNSLDVATRQARMREGYSLTE